MIPCKSNKCILYPVCKNKEEIYCGPLLKYIQSLYEELNGIKIYRESKQKLSAELKFDKKAVWIIINGDLPNLSRIYGNPEKHSGYTPYVTYEYTSKGNI